MPEAIGYVHTLHGEAMAGTEGELRFLHEGDAVYQDEIITTAHEGALEIRFLDNTILAQGPDSEMVLDEYAYDPETGIGHAAFDLTEGTFRSVTGAIVDHNPEAFRLSTPLSDIGIRGTTTAHHVPGPDAADLTETHLVLVYDGKPVAVTPRVVGGEFRLIAESGGRVQVGLHETGQVHLMTRAEFEYYQQLATQNLEQQAPAFHSPEEILLQHPDLNEPVTREDLERAAEQAAEVEGEWRNQDGGEQDHANPTHGDADHGNGNQADANQADGSDQDSREASPNAAEQEQADPNQDDPNQDQNQADGETEGQGMGEQLQDAESVSVLYGGGRDMGLGTVLSTESPGDLTALSQDLNQDQGLFSSSSLSLSGGLPPDLPLSTLDLLAALADGEEAGDSELILVGGSEPEPAVNPFLNLSYVDFSDGWPVHPPDPEDGGSWDNLLGGSGGDDLTGGAAHDQIFGYQGDDTIQGLGEDDRLLGGRGDDVLYGDGPGTPGGAEGNDEFLPGPGNDVVIGGGEDYSNPDLGGGDTVIYAEMDAHNLDIDLGAGTATYDFEGVAYTDALSGIENAMGSANNDDLTGDSGNNRLSGEGGDDNLWGLAGDDEFVYEQGHGHDMINGGADTDRLVFHGSYGHGLDVHYVTTLEADIYLDGTLVAETTDVEWIEGTDQADVISSVAATAVVRFDGREGDDSLTGGILDDILQGGDGNDQLVGNYGADVLEGGKGDDLLRGEEGHDQLTGNAGNDIFQWDSTADLGTANWDTLMDFQAGDRLHFDLSGGFSGTFSFETQAGYDGHTAGGSGAYFVLDTSTDMLFYDADGDGAGAGQEVCVLDNGYELDGSEIQVA